MTKIKNLRYLTYTREQMIREYKTRGENFLKDWYAFWFGDEEKQSKAIL